MVTVDRTALIDCTNYALWETHLQSFDGRTLRGSPHCFKYFIHAGQIHIIGVQFIVL